MNTFRFKISLRFFGSSFDPSDLSTELGIKPTRMWKAGERRTTPKGRELEGIYDESYCTFNIERHGEENLSETLERALASFGQYKDIFHRICIEGGRIEFFIGWFSVGNSGDTLPYKLMSKLAELEIDLALDVYGSNETCVETGTEEVE
ncbi:DUF4279 domain-containing protein [Rhodanobacter denitrificans]|uniref:DUF4279 domain-containing protein n=1 Tax=Rhodanobacter denitrificans TaxID=666685 RepID=M4NQ91_9GAMM|nr:DUF4279 domain-containing protein [Rhodanobacter denitrificans]AGG89781.1 hypothetical protein R2APBS1_2702 [Rhodanobacter denitrificans]UJM85179.1 DUF4279 domain-containing protein [Rhodanobacter denitrificans]